jgi:hypothetical protein
MARMLLALAALVAVCNAFKSLGLSVLRPLAASTSSYSRLSHVHQSASIKLVEPFGKGLMEDIKRKSPYIKSDVTDALTPAGALKAVSATFFLFFACLAPAVAFGGLLASATGGAMGTMEAVGATALGGFLYAMFSGQPITIIGTTGPLLAFLKVLYSACASTVSSCTCTMSAPCFVSTLSAKVVCKATTSKLIKMISAISTSLRRSTNCTAHSFVACA